MDNKLNTNARSVGTETQYEIRKSIIRLLKSGKSGREVAKLLSVSEGHVSNTKKSYDEKGIEGLKIGQRGRKEGANRSLTPEQEEEIKNIIIDKTPEQLNFKECMWNRKNIRELILRKYNIDMPLSTLGYYLQRWGLTVQRPVKRAYKQDEKKLTIGLIKNLITINEQK